MPELPEVETIVRALAPRLTGARIAAASFPCARVLRGPAPQVIGRVIDDIRRRGKFVLFQLDDGTRLEVHLGMTGALLLNRDPGPYTRATLSFDEQCLQYDDIRQFGRIEHCRGQSGRSGVLGPEPLALDAQTWREHTAGRRGKLKLLLLNQSYLAGLGNIYCDEALFRARLHPDRTMNNLQSAERQRLLQSVQAVLSEAIACHGSSISDYVDPDGRPGSFQERHRVYGRQGHPCPRCGAAIVRILSAQRGTHLCPICQPRSAGLRY
ncbi:MAG: bifunctional DNA-formamidopyrimidine glycosylase/DNA-(apurinic or apyrimidinic site) lyase [Bryobacterales bacterium]|nr:bifunctional DNA-formamidopyrimidine glycosylase/DNA-(apurinic or apyrimidinic site) lyase [Bryobacterales bacterium]